MSQETNCTFDMITIWDKEDYIYYIQNEDHNHDLMLARTYSIYRKILCIKEVSDQIANHTKTNAPL